MGITGMIYMVPMVFSLIVLISCSSTMGYNYFQFTQQYQPAVCNSNPTPCKDPPDKLFTVHGLWPSNDVGDDPIYCKNKTIKSQQIGNLTAQLIIIWPNVLDRTDHVGFWNRQWNKHGSCGKAPTIKDEMHYFKTVIKMYITQKQNVSEILSRAKIEPEGKIRRRDDIINAIRLGTKDKKPKLKCQKNNQTTELVEITICSDRNLTQFIDCPRSSFKGSPFHCPTNHILY
uniref:Ribonuclease S-6 n=4 Tax=Pyrus TaxID=3766 RepID=RNS6_PYRPY|nr:RecName: Full=Ribonuclease S-6; AltName: Full=S6-RNase; Flags: Precursor [Pyrus pyrifolia]AVB77355.1 S6-RNase [Pyrus pyrifolia]BAA32415.1 S6-RNase [Pyrus pyrifolia]